MGPMKSPHRDAISNSADAVHNILVKRKLKPGDCQNSPWTRHQSGAVDRGELILCDLILARFEVAACGSHAAAFPKGRRTHPRARSPTISNNVVLTPLFSFNVGPIGRMFSRRVVYVFTS